MGKDSYYDSKDPHTTIQGRRKDSIVYFREEKSSNSNYTKFSLSGRGYMLTLRATISS